MFNDYSNNLATAAAEGFTDLALMGATKLQDCVNYGNGMDAPAGLVMGHIDGSSSFSDNPVRRISA